MPAIRHSRALPLLTGMVGMTMTEAAGRVWASGLLAPAHGPGLRAEALAVRIFGPLTIMRGGAHVPLRSDKQRRLLALLALHPSRTVPHEEIIRTLWDEAAPEDARSLLHAHVARLRTVVGGRAVVAQQGGYRLDLTTGRDSDDWRFGTRTETSWSFGSDTTTSPTLLPLLQVDYSVPVDAENAVGPQRTYTLGFDVRMPDGLPAPHGSRLKVETSYDDGKTWVTAQTSAPRGKAGHFTAAVERPSRVHGNSCVTLRITAADDAGHSVRQTIDRAFLHRGSAARQ